MLYMPKTFFYFLTNLGPISVLVLFFQISGQTSLLYPYWLTFFYLLTNLGPI